MSEHGPVRLFDTVGVPARQAFEAAGTEIAYAPGDTLVSMGDASTAAFLLVSGYAKVFVRTSGGVEALLAVRGPGELIGELGVLDDRGRSAHVAAAGPLTCRRIDRHTFLKLLGEHRDADRAVRETVIAKLRAAAQRQLDYLTGPSRRRLAHAVLDLFRAFGEADPDGTVIPVPLTQDDWAAMIGVTGRTVSTTFAQLRDCVRTGYRGLVVTDPVRLRAVGQAE